MNKGAPKPCSRHPWQLIKPQHQCPLCIERERNRERHRKQGVKRPYDLTAWKRTRLVQLGNEPLCRHHKERGKYVAATEVDHIDGNEWNWEPDNLQSLCHECHSIKTARENGGFGRGNGKS